MTLASRTYASGENLILKCHLTFLTSYFVLGYSQLIKNVTIVSGEQGRHLAIRITSLAQPCSHTYHFTCSAVSDSVTVSQAANQLQRIGTLVVILLSQK